MMTGPAPLEIHSREPSDTRKSDDCHEDGDPCIQHPRDCRYFLTREAFLMIMTVSTIAQNRQVTPVTRMMTLTRRSTTSIILVAFVAQTHSNKQKWRHSRAWSRRLAKRHVDAKCTELGHLLTPDYVFVPNKHPLCSFCSTPHHCLPPSSKLPAEATLYFHKGLDCCPYCSARPHANPLYFTYLPILHPLDS